MLKAVVFDLDGTLIDSTPAIMKSFEYTFETAGIPMPSFDTIYKTISMALEDQFKALCDADPEELTAIFREHYFPTCTQGTHLLPGVEEAIQQIRCAGLTMAIATSKSHKGSEIILEHMGIWEHFDCVVGGDQVKHHKPHPECLEQVLDQLGLEADDAVFVGDTEYDTEAAYRVGMDCIAVATGYAPKDELDESTAEAVFDTMEQAVAHIFAEYGLKSAESGVSTS